MRMKMKNIFFVIIIFSICIIIIYYLNYDNNKKDLKIMKLPEPNITGHSIELSINSRISYHEGYKGHVSDQWLSNVLWAANLAPITGNYRDIYVTSSNGKYKYESVSHSLSNRTSGNSGEAGFILNYDRELNFDVGVSYMFAMLASVSMWEGTDVQLASCPKQESLYFGIMDVKGITDELAIRSSDKSLPDPRTNGNNSLRDVIKNLRYTNKFAKKNLSLYDISQLLWAGYGNTPHETYNGHGGLTVPSWYADYYLTENIYVVNREGVFRYHNRNLSKNLSSRDHRIEQLKKGDLRDVIRSIGKEIPDAPCYIILCLDKEDMDKWYAQLETGFVGGNMLLQGSAIGVGCWFTTKLDNNEWKKVMNVIDVNSNDFPLAIVSLGYVEI